ncbi:MAG TPA: SAM-dependent methyltransferase [Candidatus Kapabacteria bacterium]|nr:SAM-dependent methyltransferase [Candidatus Kapabacteria bacterium]
MSKQKNNNKSQSQKSLLEAENGVVKDKLLKKIPNWADLLGLHLPSKISVEQASSQATAQIKSSLIKFSTVVDLTGGFGVDSFYLAMQADSLTYIEKVKDLHDKVKMNFSQMGVKNIYFINDFAENYLQQLDNNIDLIYCDPARRLNSKKIHNLEDSEPNIIDLFELIKRKCKYFMLKSSPFLDIQSVISSLDSVSKVILISVDNELKEVLYLFDFKHTFPIEYKVFIVNKKFCSFYLFSNTKYTMSYSYPLSYLYEPNSAIFKLGNYSEIASIFSLHKLEQNSHLFTSEQVEQNFPGNIYKIINILKVNYKELHNYSLTTHYNLKVRNFPMSVDELKKKLKIIDGGDKYIFATKLIDQSYKLIVCEKINI